MIELACWLKIKVLPLVYWQHAASYSTRSGQDLNCMHYSTVSFLVKSICDVIQLEMFVRHPVDHVASK